MIAALFLTTLATAGPHAQEADSTVLAVERLFARSCAACHGPGSDKPKATRRWPDASDLQATALDPELIVPGDPSSSTLYLALLQGEMPPSSSDAPPPTEQELAAVHDWILGGAVSGPGRSAGIGSSQAPSAAAAMPTRPWWMLGYLRGPILEWLGRFHPTVVHFPIALLMAALFAEAASVALRRPNLEAATQYCLYTGALSAPPAAVLGWLLAANGSHPAAEVRLHLLLGASVAVCAPLIAVLAPRFPRARRILLVMLAAWVGLVGHTGGGLAYGADWLAPPF